MSDSRSDVCLCICRSDWSTVCVFVFLCVCLIVWLTYCMCVSLPVWLFDWPTECMCLTACLILWLSVWATVCVSVWPASSVSLSPSKEELQQWDDPGDPRAQRRGRGGADRHQGLPQVSNHIPTYPAPRERPRLSTHPGLSIGQSPSSTMPRYDVCVFVCECVIQYIIYLIAICCLWCLVFIK